MIVETIPALGALSSDQKIILAAELWRDAMASSDEHPKPELLQALRERLDYFQNNPGEVSVWEDVRARVKSSSHPSEGLA